MIGYNPSHLNKNETLLEAFHRVEAYLIEHPLYQLYQTTDNYVVDKFDYSLGNIVLPDYGEVSAGDVVLFNNVYYAVVLSVDKVKQTFNIDEGIDFRGPQGPQGPQGPKGEPGTNPNLFINPNFAINQRGQSEYTCSSKKYTVDRTSSNRSVITPLQGGGIKLNVLSGQSNPYIQQVVEHATALVGKRLAFSCCINGVIGEIVFSELVPSEDSTTNVFVNKGFSVGAITCNIQLLKYKPQTADDSVLQVNFTIANPNDTIISWWKLEVGEVCTPYIPPNAAEEFLKCTYYYKKLGRVGTQNQYGDAYAYNSTTLWLPIADALSTMRKDKNPTITCDHLENLRCVTNTGLAQGLIPTAVGFAGGAISLTVSGATQSARYRVLDGASTENGIFGIDIEI